MSSGGTLTDPKTLVLVVHNTVSGNKYDLGWDDTDDGSGFIAVTTGVPTHKAVYDLWKHLMSEAGEGDPVIFVVRAGKSCLQ